MISLRCYDPSDSQTGGIHQWYNGLPASVRAGIDNVLDQLQLEDGLHDAISIKPLRGACLGLTEIIINIGKDEEERFFRILGFEWPSSNEFTLLTGFEKTPQDTGYNFHCPQAHQRKQGVMRDGRKIAPCNFP